MGLNWTVLLFLSTLLICGHSLDWVGAGNWTFDNITRLGNIIGSFNKSASTVHYTFIATTISSQLNDEWAPAWNVFIIYYPDGNNYDAVLYGYGFNDHWFWFNGLRLNNGKYVSFIIWKDYNCEAQKFYNPLATTPSPASSFAESLEITVNNYIQGGYSGRDVNDIWRVAQDIQNQITKSSATQLFGDKLAYTIIASQAGRPQFFGSFCAANYITIPDVGMDGTATKGSAFILQMRST